ncbi:MAG: SDR family oxidoreductase [Gammaproteobacteria bacterium]|nr:SDR family oxidoreductase [Gammaproteobacteria bacterium]
MKGVFITGASGNVGSRLAKEYLTCSNYKLFLLVRGKSQQHATDRLKKVLAFWEVPFEQYRDRIEALCGDITQPDLGLTTDQIAAISDQVHLFIHAASNIRLDLTVEDARRMILGGTQNAYRLSRNFPHLERFGFISTMEVIGRYEGLVKEEFLTNYKLDFINTYEMAKFEAEEFLRQQIESGASISIYRPTMVVGEAATGKALGFQSFYMMVEKMLLDPDYPILPIGPPVDTIPVDILAQGIVKLMEYPDARNQVYHFAQGLDDPITFPEFIAELQSILEAQLHRKIRRPLYVTPIFHRLLLGVLSKVTWGRLRRFFRVQLIFIKFAGLSWSVDNQKTRNTLRTLGVNWPRISQYLPTLIGYYLKHRDENKLPF